MMKFNHIEYASPKHILAIPDHYVALGVMHEKATASEPGLATLVEGRYIVKAGTVYTSTNINGNTLTKHFFIFMISETAYAPIGSNLK